MELEFTTSKPLADLSVLVSSYNKVDFLSQSTIYLHELANLGAQVVVIEDSSTDGSIELLQSWPGVKNGSITLILQENAGSAVSRNNSIALADRLYLLFVDIDDVIDVEVLQDFFSKVKASNADLGLAGYVQVPSQRPGPYPLKDFANETTHISNFRSELFEGVGWWRYLYKKSVVDAYNLRFVPSFKEMGERIFVLDDLLWLLHIFSMDLTVYRGNNSHILYQYFLPDKNSSARLNWYLDQVVLMPDALNFFLSEISNHHCTHDERWLLTTCHETLWQHANFLGIFRFLQAFPKILGVSLKIDEKLNDGLHFNTLKCSVITAARLTLVGLRSIANAGPASRA